jgi:zinc finger protein 830
VGIRSLALVVNHQVMSDVRALLKAKRQEARVSHPLASYSSNGQLRCIACSTIIKQSSAWDGHVGSKAHRVNVIKMKDQQKQKEQEELQAATTHKRKADEDEDEDMETEETAVTTKKQRIEEPVHPPAQPTSGFPANFFSDPSRAPAVLSVGDSDDEEDGQDRSTNIPAPVPEASNSNNPLDIEWTQFQQAMLVDAPAPPPIDLSRDVYKRATVFVEPELHDTMEGLPGQHESELKGEIATQSMEEAPIRILGEEDERQLIMDRFLEEERAQEEADAKVTLLKSKLDALKKRRQAAREAKAKSG